MQGYYKQNVCTNCGIIGHHYKHCSEPITSYGIIAFRINDDMWNQPKRLLNDELTGLPEKKIEFLLIQRRDSIGFVELIRAKYKLNDIEYIRDQIMGITLKEREALKTKTFDELWTGLWGSLQSTENRQYRQEYEQAKLKHEQLCSGIEVCGKKYTLASLIDSTPLIWNTPEWGFPKGRRNIHETDFKCALREFTEETGILSSDIRIFENIEPIKESFFGSNNIHYRHVYFLAWVPRRVNIGLKPDNQTMMREVGNIKWFSIEDALHNIRSTNLEKREVLLRASSLLRNLSPIFVGPVVSMAEQEPQTEALLQNRNRTNESNTNSASAASTTTTFFNPWDRKTKSSQFSFVED
jgi:8-oxo-dGTP pyrophosphatase MutT (NUDIX family)